MTKNGLSAGILGTGFIASYHVAALRRLPGVRLTAVCDVNASRAQAFARSHGVPKVHVSLEALLASHELDVIHVLTPPDTHFAAARCALAAGVHAFMEKPMCTTAEDCHRLEELAAARELCLGVSHNFLFYPIYERLAGDLRSGRLGRPDHISIVWNCELGPLRSGPFDSWMLRDPRNVMLEVGPHSVAQMFDLVGPPDRMIVRATDSVELPGRRRFYRRWRVLADCGTTGVDMRFSFGPGFPERFVHLRGSLGTGTADFGHNTYVAACYSRYGDDFARFQRATTTARELRMQARRNLRDYALSKLGLSDRGNAFEYSIMRSVSAFYAGLGKSSDDRQGGRLGCAVVNQCIRIGEAAEVEHPMAGVTRRDAETVRRAPYILVLGGTGFIGRELVGQLLRAGHSVRLMTRHADGVPFDVEDRDLQIVEGSLLDDGDTGRAVHGMRYVFDLARGAGKRWSDYYEQDVLAAERVGRCCLREGVQRLIYTGTIASYYTGAGAGTITERTPLDHRLVRRDHYCRAKGMAEQLLMRMHRERGLPVVIFRPAIVIGRGGNPYHWGIGMWTDGGVCQMWGEGRNKLPLVLVEDVATALIAGMETPDIEGESFNLASRPMLSAREYVFELERHAGVKLQVFHTPIRRFYCMDVFKWLVKVAVGHRDRRRPSYRDWESRTGKAVFDCSKAVTRLGWRPTEDRDDLVNRGIRVPLDEMLGRSQSTPPAVHQESPNLVLCNK
ncbi:MAG: NAD-dependent epimerase/dehydratase family protein [Planctomycetota bacterium]